MSELIYLYGHVSAEAVVPPIQGVGECLVEAVDCGSLRAVVSRVPSSDFSAETIEARLEDLDWVGRTGLDHERVVAALVDRTTVLPARLFTLFSTEAALRRDCEQRRRWLEGQLARLDGLREWDLKVSADYDRLAKSDRPLSDEVAALDREIEQATPGKRYLLERRRAEAAKDGARAAAGALAAGVLAEVERRAREVRQLDPPRTDEPGQLPVVLHGAALVEREAEAELARAVAEAAEELASSGLRVDFSGPWAPYRFIGSA